MMTRLYVINVFLVKPICHLHRKKKWIHFDRKIGVIGGTKFNPEYRVIGEYFSQISSQY